MSEQLDPWKRPIKPKVPVKESRYEQQLELQLNKTVDATEAVSYTHLTLPTILPV